MYGAYQSRGGAPLRNGLVITTEEFSGSRDCITRWSTSCCVGQSSTSLCSSSGRLADDASSRTRFRDGCEAPLSRSHDDQHLASVAVMPLVFGRSGEVYCAGGGSALLEEEADGPSVSPMAQRRARAPSQEGRQGAGAALLPCLSPAKLLGSLHSSSTAQHVKIQEISTERGED